MTPINSKFIIAVTLFCFFAVSLSAAEETAYEVAIKKLRENPIFHSSLDWIENPTPCENSAAQTESEMKPYSETIKAIEP